VNKWTAKNFHVRNSRGLVMLCSCLMCLFRCSCDEVEAVRRPPSDSHLQGRPPSPRPSSETGSRRRRPGRSPGEGGRPARVAWRTGTVLARDVATPPLRPRAVTEWFLEATSGGVQPSVLANSEHITSPAGVYWNFQLLDNINNQWRRQDWVRGRSRSREKII